MERAEAEEKASHYDGAVVARVVRDGDGRLIFDLPQGFTFTGLRLLGPSIVEEGRFVVLIPTADVAPGT